MKYLNFVLISLLFSQIGVSQIDTISQNNNNSLFNKSELSTLSDSIAIILIGARNHYDGKAIEAVTECIIYLNEFKGYNQVLLEINGLYVDLCLKNCKSAEEFSVCMHTAGLRKNERYLVYDIFFKLLYNKWKKKEIGIYGINVGLSISLLNFIESNFICIQYENDWFYLSNLMELARINGVLNEQEFNKFIYYKNILLNKAKNYLDEKCYNDFKKCLRGIENSLLFYRNNQFKGEFIQFKGSMNVRDSIMFKEAERIIKDRPNGKFIIFTSAFHSAKRVINYKKNKDKPLGSYFSEKGYSIYSIATIANRGFSGIDLKYNFLGSPKYVTVTKLNNKRKEILWEKGMFRKLPRKKKNSIESKLDNSNRDVIYQSLKLYNFKYKSYFMNPTYSKSIKENWSEIYDAVIFFKTMEPLEGKTDFIYNKAIDISYRFFACSRIRPNFFLYKKK